MDKTMDGNKQIFLCTATYHKFSNQDWSEIAHQIAKAAGLTPLDWACQHFPVHGSTYFWFLAESHIALDTYPEVNKIEITLVSCREFNAYPIIALMMDLGLIIKDYVVYIKQDGQTWLP